MFSFKGFLTKGVNTHLEHLEDDIINNGSKGGRNALNFLRAVKKMLAGNTGGRLNITTKWDGAPAIICGVNPENGKFFVGTKSVFNKTPKINYTPTDIRKNHSGPVADKLMVCLRELKRLGIRDILQGDLLFTPGEVKAQAIDGENYYTFTPNTITYAVQAKSDIGKKIARARMGIVFHTKYSGKNMASLNASFGSITGKPRSGSVFVTDAVYKDASGTATFNNSESAQFDGLLRMAEGSLSKANAVLDDFNTSDQLAVGFRLKVFFNYYIRNNAEMGKVRQLVDMFREYYQNILKAEIDGVKRESSKDKYRQIMKDGVRYIDRNKSALYFAIASYISLQNAKNFLIRKMNQIQSIGHFIKTPNGFKVTAPEGYVAVDRVAGAVKLVDRLEFSRANFTIAKDWIKG